MAAIAPEDRRGSDRSHLVGRRSTPADMPNARHGNTRLRVRTDSNPGDDLSPLRLETPTRMSLTTIMLNCKDEISFDHRNTLLAMITSTSGIWPHEVRNPARGPPRGRPNERANNDERTWSNHLPE